MTFLDSDKIIILTGVTAGIGQKALDLAAQNLACRVYIGARDPLSVPEDLRSRMTVLSLDLASLKSVYAFCSEIIKAGPISGLVLNAGLSPRTPQKTKDGFDLAFQVNYLSHFAMIRTLWDQLTDDAHIVITSSGTHDPAEKTPPPPPRHADAFRLAKPHLDQNRDRSNAKAASRSYTSSKLCCTMLSLELAARRPIGTSISFDPGLVPGTRLTRDFPDWLVRILLPIMARTMPPDRTSTLAASASALAHLIVQTSLVGKNGDYIAMRGGYPIIVQPSVLARERSVREALWRDSEALLDTSDT